MVLAYSIYTFLFATTLFFAHFKSWRYWAISILFYTSIIGLRENVGIDYMSYKRVFQYLLLQNAAGIIEYDMIYYIFIPIVKNYHYNFFIAFLAFVTIFFLFRSFENRTKILPLYFFFFFTFLTFFMTLNIMRQYAAAFIVFFAMNQYLEKNYKRFILYFIMALMLHRSCIVLVPFIFLFKNDFLKWSWLQYVFLFSSIGMSAILFKHLTQLLSLVSHSILAQGDIYGSYLRNFEFRTERVLEMRKAHGGTGLFNYLTLFINSIAIYFSNELKEKYTRYHVTFFYNFYIIGTILSPIFSLNEGTSRLIKYFTFYSTYIYAILFHYLLYQTNKKSYLIRLMCTGILLLGIVFFYVTIYRRTMDIAPFQFLEL